MKVSALVQSLLRYPSVTPEDAGAQEYLAGVLDELGLKATHLPFKNIKNLFARIGANGPHFCFAGHTDVVPPGDESAWTHPPFSGEISDGVVYGRGAVDMKGNIAAFIAALAQYLEKHGAPPGSVSLLITGDEEGEAVNGTVKVLEWMKEKHHIPDFCLVGEPTNPSKLGEQIKIGRRGSLTGRLTVKGTQGHVAYPHNADNPLPRLLAMLNALAEFEWDRGTEFFPPTNLEITTIDVGNKADNVIPGEGRAVFNVRFNDLWSAASLEKKIRALLGQFDCAYRLETSSNAESFITQPNAYTELVSGAVEDVTGMKPALTTEGGTSDARFIQNYCPVAEFGLINATAHQVDEHASVADLELLTDVYLKMLERFFV